MKTLNRPEIETKLSEAKDWIWDRKLSEIKKDFKFENFTDAVCFLNRIAEIAEQENHHPDLHLTDYRHLRVVLSTHSVGGLTKKDFILAAKIDEANS